MNESTISKKSTLHYMKYIQPIAQELKRKIQM
jgi:hypothetical protein